MVRLTSALFLLLLSSCFPGSRPDTGSNELILCGDKEVFILDLAAGEKKIWSWRAEERPEIPEELRKRFGTTDDCKPADGGAAILITSSGGAVALVERATGRAVFWAAVENAHSAEMLPGGRILVAGSTGKNGNRIVLFDRTRPGQELASYPLQGAHGAVWDPETRAVWALGETELHTYALEGWDVATPSLALTRRIALPDAGGHDLRPIPGTRKLVLTTRGNVWTLDRNCLLFEAHDRLGSLEGVKCVDVHPGTGRIAFVQAETSWWASRVRFLSPDGEVQLPGERIYKARWNAAAVAAR
jgi:hypothetical protein